MIINKMKSIDAIGFLSLLTYIYLVYCNEEICFYNLYTLLTVIFIEWIWLFVLFFLLSKNESILLSNLESKKIRYKIIFWSLLFQFVGLFCQSILDDDYFRYLWDGYVFSTTGNPYKSFPANYFEQSLPDDMNEILNLVSYPHLRTIYGPVCQYLFLLANYFRPHQIFVLKILLIIANVISTSIISQFAKMRYFVLFAWCPLLIIETVFELHIEIISIMFVLIATYLAFKNQSQTILKNIFLMLCCACAVAAKIFAAPFIFLVLLRCRLKYWPLFFIFMIMLYYPFISNASHTDIPSLNIFLFQWQFNGSVFEIFNFLIGQLNGHLLSFSLFAVMMLSYTFYWKVIKQQSIPRGDIVYGILLLLSPVVNPWYLLWVLPFAAIYPGYWTWIAFMMVPLSYVNGFYLVNSSYPPYQIPFIIQLIEYTPVFLALLLDFYRKPQLKFA